MTNGTGSNRQQAKRVGRLPKILAIVGAGSLVLPLSVFAASAAMVQPSTRLTAQALLVSSSQGVTNHGHFVTPADVSWGNSVAVASARRHGPWSGPVTTTTVAPATTTTAAPVATTTAAPVATTTVAPVTTTTAVAPVTTTTGGGSALQPVGAAPGTWNLNFDSEFNGTSLNGSQWSTGWFGSGITKGINSAETECMDPAQVSVSNGELDLTSIQKSETCGGVTQPYTSGMVTTHGLYNFTYGYAEARIWMPGSGSSISEWPAFWTDGQSWPTDGENDIVEGLGGQAQAHFHDASGTDGPLTGKGAFTGGWHTFGADWEPGSVTYYYDGVKIGTFTNGITGAPMYIIIDLAVAGGAGVPSATMRVDYVRVWQH